MNRLRLLATCMGLAIVALTLGLCQRRPVPTKPLPILDLGKIRYPYPELGIKVENYPKVDGSTSTQPLQMILACKVFGVGNEWFHDEGDDTRRLWPNEYDESLGKSRDESIQKSLLCDHIRNLVRPHGTS